MEGLSLLMLEARRELGFLLVQSRIETRCAKTSTVLGERVYCVCERKINNV